MALERDRRRTGFGTGRARAAPFEERAGPGLSGGE